jgi:thiamine-phosphate pyrophosphorylase
MTAQAFRPMAERSIRALCAVTPDEQDTAALAAERAGASYVAFGGFFPSVVRPGAVRAPLQLLWEAKKSVAVPVVAIDRITTENAPQLIAVGAGSIGVISALFDPSKVQAAARQLARPFPPER